MFDKLNPSKEVDIERSGNDKETPFVSVVVACVNECRFIARCLDSIVSNDYPKSRLEVLVVDGMSDDGTRAIVENYTRKFEFIRLLDNRSKITPCAFNIGIRNAQGDVIMIMGSHSVYKQDYISTCVKFMLEYGADNVGGIIKTLPRDDHPTARAIAISLSHPFGVGNSTFRTGTKEPQWVDTVFGGCYRKEVFDKVGLFNERLVRSQDMDFNIRLKAAGGRILLVPSVESIYYSRSSIKDFFTHNFRDGVWSIYPIKFGSSLFKLRHLLPLGFVMTFVGSLLLSLVLPPFLYIFLGLGTIYLLSSLYFSLRIALRENCRKYAMILPSVFAARHFGYGFGSVWGALRVLL